MNDINYQLRKAYYTLITGEVIIDSTPVPMFYAQVPDGINPSIYILITSLTSTPLTSDRINRTLTNIQLNIVTKRNNNNDGFDNDEIAYQIFSIIYPAPEAQVVQISNGQLINTQLQNDNVLTGLTDGSKVVVNRIITFTHLILHYPYDSGLQADIYYGTMDAPGTPVSFSSKIIENPNAPFTIPFGAQSTARVFWIATPVAKSEWEDINDPANSGTIGGTTDLFYNTNINIFGSPYTLQQTRYITGFTNPNQVKFT